MLVSVFYLWHAFCTFIQHVRGRYNMVRKGYKVELLNENEGKHENMDATWKNGATFDRIVDNLSKMETTYLKLKQHLHNYMGLKYSCAQGCHTDNVSKNQEITGALNVCLDLWPLTVGALSPVGRERLQSIDMRYVIKINPTKCQIIC